jgi:hypothetical protein
MLAGWPLPRSRSLVLLLTLWIGFVGVNLQPLLRDSFEAAQPAPPLNFPTSSTITADDPDGDGLTTDVELALKLDPMNVDSDCDQVDDRTEVNPPAAPLDRDGDGLIDARENNWVDSDGDRTVDSVDPVSSVQASCLRFSTFAISQGEQSRVEVTLLGTSVLSASVTLESDGSNSFTLNPPLRLDGAPLPSGQAIALFDDGTNGDVRSNDGIWSRGGIGAAFTDRTDTITQYEIDTIAVGTGSGVVTLAQTRGRTGSPGILGLIGPAVVVQRPVQVAPDLQAVSHAYAIIDPLGSLALARYESSIIARRFYRSVPADEYDFLMFVPEMPLSRPGAVGGLNTQVRNEVRNIGEPIVDQSANFGSSGRLRSVITLAFGSRGPALHELMHAFGAPGTALAGLGFSQCTDMSHWGVVGHGRGLLGGFDPTTLIDAGNNTYRVSAFSVGGNAESLPYTPLERYLFGLGPASAVPPVTVPLNVVCGSIRPAGVGGATFSASGLRTVTIDEIQAALGGPRQPAFGEAQQAFRAAMVMIAQRPLTPSELAFINSWSQELANAKNYTTALSFAEASGTGTLDTRIAEASQPQTFTPDTLRDEAGGGCERPCSLRAAVLAANQSGGSDTIQLGQGVYQLSRSDAGPLLVADDLTIMGAGAATTIIDGGQIDQILHVLPGVALTVQGVTLRNGSAPTSDGGAIRSDGRLILDSVVVRESRARRGGGIFARGTLTLRNSSVINNRSTSGGGGLNVEVPLGASVLEVTIRNTTLSGNTAPNGSAAQFLLRTGSAVVLDYVTLGDSSDGPALAVSRPAGETGGTFTINSTLIARNAGDNCALRVPPVGANNLSDDASCSFTSGSNLTTSDAKIAPLADNGGPTPTHGLYPESPALNAAGETCPATDQRGSVRPVGERCDIGAFEGTVEAPQNGAFLPLVRR